MKEYDGYGGLREYKPKKWLGGVIAIGIGAILFIVGAVRYFSAVMRFKDYLPVTGKVVAELNSLSETTGHHSETITYKPLMEYTVGNTTYQSSESFYTSARYRVGGTMTMYYNPLNPYQISLKKKEPIGLFLFMFGLWIMLGGGMAAVMTLFENDPPTQEIWTSYFAGAEFMAMPLGIFFLLGAVWHPVDLLLGLFFLIGAYVFIQGIVLTVKRKKARKAEEESYY